MGAHAPYLLKINGYTLTPLHLLVRKNEISGVQFTLDWDPTGYATSGSPMVERKKILA